MFARRGIEWKAPGQSTVAYLDARGSLSPRTMLVHGVGVSASDRFILSRTGTAWAHCPKSNAKLGNGVAPLSLLRGEEGLNPIGIGSDSVASNNSIDLFEEMRFAVLMQRASRRKIGVLNAQDVVEMATLGGARALGLEAEIGSLTVGKRADLCVVRIDDLHSIPAYDPYNALVYASRASDVLSTWVEGVCLYNADMSGKESWERRFLHTDPAVLTDAKARLLAAAERQREWRG
ncbi:MAG: amidohydrolase family protein [Chthonomonadaceae bacterium]|nr:amidohydrolase family protein [Chthonomonadaceae bacterium]